MSESAETGAVDAIGGVDKEPTPPAMAGEGQESDLSEATETDEPADTEGDEPDTSGAGESEAGEDEPAVNALDERQLTSGDSSQVAEGNEPMVTALDEPQAGSMDESRTTEPDEREISETDSSDSSDESGAVPSDEGESGADPSGESAEDQSEGSDWVDAHSSEPLTANGLPDLNLGENDPAEASGHGGDAGEDVADGVEVGDQAVTEESDSVSPAANEPDSLEGDANDVALAAAEASSGTPDSDQVAGGRVDEVPQNGSHAQLPVMTESLQPGVVPAETIGDLERRIAPLTPDSLSPEDGGPDSLGKMKICVDTGLVSAHDLDMKRTAGEGEESVSDEDRRVQEENTINELKSKTVSGAVVDSVKEEPAAPQSGRRLIKADPSLAAPCSTTFDDDDDDPDFPETPATPHCPKPSPRGGLGLGYRTGGTTSTNTNTSAPSHWQQNMALDLATQRVSFKSDRRHTLCEAAMSRSRPSSALSNRSSGSDETPMPHQPGSHVASELQRQFLASSQWTDMECLSLTLEEVVHIRSVLTKAELDSLPVECHIKEDVARGKLCFLCMKTRFSFFGAKGNNCRLCQRVVCAKCCAKMRIPTDHFASIPVYTLTPSSLSPQEEEARSLLSRLQVPELPSFTAGTMGSPASPSNSGGSPEQSQSLPPQPLLQQVESKLRRTRLYRSRTLARPEDLESAKSDGDRDDLGGVLMTVCKDCKAMVLHIIVTWKKRRDRSKRASAPARPRSLFIAAVR